MAIADRLKELAENNAKLEELNNRMGVALSGDVEKPKRYLDYDMFWYYFQDKGNRDYYTEAFWNGNFSVDTFYPKYNIKFGEKPQGGCFQNFFSGENDDYSIRFSLKNRLEECGVTLDTSRATHLDQCFLAAYFMTELPTIDLRGVSGDVYYGGRSGYEVYRLFGYMYYLETIEKLIVKEEIAPRDTFNYCYSLKNIVVEGTIGKSGFNLRHSTELSKASIESFIDALSTSPDCDGENIVFSLEAVNKAYETSDGANDGADSEEWLALEEEHRNWEIILVPFEEA